MRITWYSNSPLTPTGYGVQTAEVVRRLKAAGHEVAIAANWGVQGAPIEWEGVPIFPSGHEKYSNDIVLAHHAAWRGDWLMTLYDVWPFIPQNWKGARVASWVPIDHEPVPPAVADWCKHVSPIAMSRFGQKMLANQGIEADYIPHTVNRDIYKPTAELKGKPTRKVLGIPDDAFIVMIAAANQGMDPPRKAWGEMFTAASMFMRSHPDAYLYVHTNPTQSTGGLNLHILANAVGLPMERLFWPDGYAYVSGRIEQTDLAALYTASDVLLATSMGEGFGVTAIEAQACGLPIIVSDFSAQPELVGGGWTVAGQPYWDAPHAAFFQTPLIGQIRKALETAYERRGDPELRQQAMDKAAEYDSDVVFEQHWKPLLAKLEGMLTTTAPEPRNRAERRLAKRARRAA